MKDYRKKIQVVLIALMMFSSVIMMSGCRGIDWNDHKVHTEEDSSSIEQDEDDSSAIDSFGFADDGSIAIQDGTDYYADDSFGFPDEGSIAIQDGTDSAAADSHKYSYDGGTTAIKYSHVDNIDENSGGSDSHSSDCNVISCEETYEDLEGCEDEEICDDLEEYVDEEVCDDLVECEDEEQSAGAEESGSGEESDSYGISEIDYAHDAYVSTNDFEITPLPARIGGTNATIKASVINHRGMHVTGAGCTIYYGYGEAIKSTLISCDYDEDSFCLQFDVNRDLEEMLDRGECYAYRIFVEADGVIYTHDKERFVTNAIDDRIEIEEQVSSVSTTSASVNVKVYNHTGATVEAIGCRFGDGIFLLSDDKVTGSFTDSEFDETFTLYSEDGEFPSGYTYTYDVYVVCNGHEYTVGTCTFKSPVY